MLIAVTDDNLHSYLFVVFVCILSLEGVFIEQLKKQAEEVLIENENLRNIIHKLNIQMSRYQAKCSPLKVT